MGCAYEPTNRDAAPWAPRYLIASGERTTVCPGYSTTLPMVSEVVEAYPHWEHGTLVAFIGGTPTRAFLDGLAALRAGIKERDAAAVAEKGGG